MGHESAERARSAGEAHAGATHTMTAHTTRGQSETGCRSSSQWSASVRGRRLVPWATSKWAAPPMGGGDPMGWAVLSAAIPWQWGTWIPWAVSTVWEPAIPWGAAVPWAAAAQWAAATPMVAAVGGGDRMGGGSPTGGGDPMAAVAIIQCAAAIRRAAGLAFARPPSVPQANFGLRKEYRHSPVYQACRGALRAAGCPHELLGCQFPCLETIALVWCGGLHAAAASEGRMLSVDGAGTGSGVSRYTPNRNRIQGPPPRFGLAATGGRRARPGGPSRQRRRRRHRRYRQSGLRPPNPPLCIPMLPRSVSLLGALVLRGDLAGGARERLRRRDGPRLLDTGRHQQGLQS